MKRCDQCKHWDRKYFINEDLAELFGNCNKLTQFWDSTEWNEEEEEKRVVKPEYKNHLAFVRDASDYRAYLITRPEFYCSHFEERQ